jgi:signal transduction histidine kinase
MIRLTVEASSAERHRVAGGLHDGPIQYLAGVGYALTGIGRPHRCADRALIDCADRLAADHPADHTATRPRGLQGGTAVVTVTDDGSGFEPGDALGPVDGHIGLALLTDAAVGIGARLDARSRPGRGITMRLAVPIPRTGPEDRGPSGLPPGRADPYGGGQRLGCDPAPGRTSLVLRPSGIPQ